MKQKLRAAEQYSTKIQSANVKANKERMEVIKGLKDKEMRNELKRKEEQIENSYNQEVKEAHVSKAFGRSKIQYFSVTKSNMNVRPDMRVQ